MAPFAHCLENIHPREGEELEAGIAHPSLNYEKGKKKPIRANLQMERKIYAQNNSAQLLVQLILQRAAWQREGLSLFFWESAGKWTHSLSGRSVLTDAWGCHSLGLLSLQRQGSQTAEHDTLGAGWVLG